jgi:hypothetical protein
VSCCECRAGLLTAWCQETSRRRCEGRAARRAGPGGSGADGGVRATAAIANIRDRTGTRGLPSAIPAPPRPHARAAGAPSVPAPTPRIHPPDSSSLRSRHMPDQARTPPLRIAGAADHKPPPCILHRKPSEVYRTIPPKRPKVSGSSLLLLLDGNARDRPQVARVKPA